MIRLAIQKKGRLNSSSMELLAEAGINVADGNGQLLTRSEDFPIEILYLRDDDIPHVVAMGVADIGIVGQNEVEEKQQNVEEVYKLGFGKCRISLAVPKGEEYGSLEYFNEKRVATSYPNILKKYFKEKNISAEIHDIAGSVEIAPSVGLADAIFDIVSSGSTLVTNGLKEVEQVCKSEAVIIANPKLTSQKREILNKLLFRFDSVKRSKGKKYMLLNLPNDKIEEVVAMLPGMKSPTILPLAQKGWSSIHVVVDENILWDKIETLKSIGAEDILVLALEKMIL